MKISYFAIKLKLLITLVLGVVLVSIPLSSAVADDDPIWAYPAMPDLINNEFGFACMADAYLDDGGKGLKDQPDIASLNCTANDIEITEVIATGVKVGSLPWDTNAADGFTCNKGDTFTLRAKVKVRTNADTRYDSTFYLPLNNKSPQLVQGETSSCSLIVPNPDATRDSEGDGPLLPGNGNNDGDVCGDIDKSDLTSDDYELIDAEFTMLCSTASPNSTQVVFNYCAAWSVKDENDCSVTEGEFDIIGQRPSQTSKCNCGVLPINVFTSPEAPSLTKKLDPDTITDSATEFDTDGNRTFKYIYTIEKDIITDVLHITGLYDVIYTDPDASPLPDGQVEKIIDLFSANPGATFGSHIEIISNSCYEASGEVILDEHTLTFSCNLEVKLTDTNHPDSLQLGSLEDPIVRNFGPNPEEVYFDYAYATFGDKFGTTIDDLKVSCNALSLEAALTSPPDAAVCSNKKYVSITNIDPQVDILKEVVVPNPNTLGLRYNSTNDIWYINKNGDITFKVSVTNPPVSGENNHDAIWASLADIKGDSSFRDDWSVEDDTNIPTEASGTVDLYNDSDAANSVDCQSIPKDSSTALIVGNDASSKFGPCDYTMTLNLEEGHTFINTAKVEVRDNENRLAYAESTVKVVLAQPMISLKKYVATVTIDDEGEVTGNGTFNDVGISINEPGDYVIWRIDIFNDNVNTMEPLRVTSIVDILKFNIEAPTSHDVTTWPDGVTPTNDACSFPQTLTWDGDDLADYSCIFVTKVTGNATDIITNRAEAKAYLWTNDNGGSTIGEEFTSNWDEAKVTLLDVPANPAINVKVSATVFVTISNPSTHESLYISEFKLNGEFIADTLLPLLSPIKLTNDGGTFYGVDDVFVSCPIADDFPSDASPNTPLIEIAKEDEYRCAFTVEILDNDEDLNTFSIKYNADNDTGLSIIVIDGEGGTPSDNLYEATVEVFQQN